MKKLVDLPLHFKVQGMSNEPAGIYHIPHPSIDNYLYHIIFSDGEGWEHLSVSLRKVINKTLRHTKSVERCPTWPEMCFLKNMFWEPSEVTIQYHPAIADYVNNHDYVLHVWKPIGVEIPTPDPILVGLKDETVNKLLELLSKRHPEMSRTECLACLYYADWHTVNIRDEKSIEEFMIRLNYLNVP